MWLYYNFFQPVMRLQEKILIPNSEQGYQLQRHYDSPRTPWQRLCATNAISPQQRQQLEQLRERTNPRQLRREIYKSLEHIFSLPGAIPGQTENVLDTLTASISQQKDLL